MPDDTPNLNLPLIQPAQAQKHITHNEALARLDALVQLCVQALDVTDPPADPSEGQVWGVGTDPTGEWDGQADRLAIFSNGAWLFLTARDGLRAWNAATSELVIRRDGGWTVLATQFLNDIDGVGIGASYDATNRLSVASPATLLSHDGAGHQLKLNKAAAADTASLLYQAGFSGRAEMGLAGTDDFSIKVSADGATWTEALRIAAATGDAVLGGISATSMTGTAVQQSATDATPGRLMRADWGYGRGTLLGPVAQSAGQPTGAAIERGGNANGDYVRFADGTQICSVKKVLSQAAASYLSVVWTFPASFAPGVVPAVSLLPNATTWAAGVGSSPSVGDVTVAQGNTTSDLTVLQVWRRTGGANFDPSDTAEMYATAFGRWF